jgi:hypothetical protein
MDNNSYVPPQQRLANSRQAIIRHMDRDASDGSESGHSGEQIDASADRWDLIKQAAGAWWRGHPAHLAFDLAKPVIQTYAEEKPLKLLGISAGIGAAAMVLRPWRLISLTGLLLATLKAPEMSGVLRSLLPGGGKQHDRFR